MRREDITDTTFRRIIKEQGFVQKHVNLTKNGRETMEDHVMRVIKEHETQRGLLNGANGARFFHANFAKYE